MSFPNLKSWSPLTIHLTKRLCLYLPPTLHLLNFGLQPIATIVYDYKALSSKWKKNIGKGAKANTNWESEVVDAATLPITDNRVAFIRKTLHSLFSNWDVLINSESVHTPIILYAQPFLIETQLSKTQGCETSEFFT